jgi:TonB family protein
LKFGHLSRQWEGIFSIVYFPNLAIFVRKQRLQAAGFRPRKGVMPLRPAILAFLLASSVTLFAQEKTGKIIFFRAGNFLDSDFKPPLFCDGLELTRIPSRSYLEIAVPSGRHICLADTAEAPETKIEVVPGDIVYVAVWVTHTMKRHAVLTMANEEEYTKQKKLKRIVNAELDAVLPFLVPVPTPIVVPANAPDQEFSTTGAEHVPAYSPGKNGVSFPQCIRCSDPPYSEQARRARLEGTVELQVVVGVDGRASNIVIVKGIDKGLTEQAVSAVETWKFKPATGPDGNPVAVTVPIEIMFRLLK